jgi:hypothetical protein
MELDMSQPDQEWIRIEVEAFDSLEGDFFDALDNPEELTCRTPLEALRELLPDPYFAAAGGLRIDAWTRQVVPEEWKAAVAARVADLLIEEFDDEDGFGSLHDATELAAADDAEVTAGARQLVDLFLSKVKVWRCEKTESVHLSRAAVNEICKREGLHVTE